MATAELCNKNIIIGQSQVNPTSDALMYDGQF